MKNIVMLLGILGTGLLLAQSAPMHYYRFDGEAIVDSVGDCHGKVARLMQADGFYGKALYFPAAGDSERNVACAVSIPIPPETFTKPFTATLWLKLDEKNSYRFFKDLLCLGRERGPGFRLTYFYNSLSLRSGDGKVVGPTVGTNSSTVLLPLKRWFQVAVTYDGEKGSIYLDGVLKASGKINLSLGKGALSVGTYANGYAYPVQGAIDELKIYGTALTHSQIVDAYLREMK